MKILSGIIYKNTIFIYVLITSLQDYTWFSQLGLQTPLTASLQRGKTPTMSVLDMTQNNLMVRLQ